MVFQTPLGFLGLISLPIIIILYLLKQKREYYSVSSTLLWREVLNDVEATKPWQKLKRNILMILQLIAAFILTLILSSPAIKMDVQGNENVIIAIDLSMSMKATDIGPSRIEAAKKDAIEYVNSLPKDTRVSIISLSDEVIIEQSFNNDKHSNISTIKSLEAKNVTIDEEMIVSYLKSLIVQENNTRLVLFSDKPLNDRMIDYNFFLYNVSNQNYAITYQSYSKKTDGTYSVLTKVTNYSSSDTTINASLYINGSFFDAAGVFVQKESSENIIWDNLPIDSTFFEARIDSDDILKEDNSYYLPVNKNDKGRVLLVTNNNLFLERALKLINGIEYTRTSPGEDIVLKDYDLYIFDEYTPEKLPEDGNSVLFNPESKNGIKILSKGSLPVIKNGDNPIVKNVMDFEFTISEANIFEMPIGSEVIMEADIGTIAYLENRGSTKVLVFGFDIHATDMPLSPAFPIMISNMVRELSPFSINDSLNVFCGEAIEFDVIPDAISISVIDPDNKTINFKGAKKMPTID